MVVPQYGHIVVAQQENHAYSQLTGCATAPYINGTPVANGMLMNDDSGLFHPGEANCFALFGGKDYSITAKDPRVTATGPTLAALSRANGKSLAGYVDTANPDNGHPPWESFPSIRVSTVSRLAEFGEVKPLSYGAHPRGD